MPKFHMMPAGYWIDRNELLDVSVRNIAHSLAKRACS